MTTRASTPNQSRHDGICLKRATIWAGFIILEVASAAFPVIYALILG